MLSNEGELIELIKRDQWMMDILEAVKQLNLPDCWVCAGFIRSKVWDTLHEFSERTTMSDIDVIFFDKTNVNEEEEKKWEEQLRIILPNIPWSVKNEARMHMVSGFPPFTSSVDAISKFPETATAIGIRMNEKNDLILTAPHGVGDLFHLVVKPTAYYKETTDRAHIYEKRVREKNWQTTWTKLNVYHI
ncbi:nucleotidyltransferase family protein [Bacillus solimangrovi]|uniref:Nucleotidyltransferase family protein n=1 Tax=Bacillus solimangrovi TaxID=1305675 RepID=A0A1E5LKI7_9BACI|nr:nucleotidyltransferase family protein [Bacillus solimangrovi]OEH94538.1 hypothetical protein BFG57_07665 [Bacillus solimangrovi]